ncbi:hypothetical protein BDV93DRAFT_609613 [Ceratobasidium sp. AG-I]|nr:hypothetical protein BDV93DRAFT_609613 [Ceratobasidium sp. AG-I]
MRCNCPRHSGQLIRPYLYERCEFTRSLQALRNRAPAVQPVPGVQPPIPSLPTALANHAGTPASHTTSTSDSIPEQTPPPSDLHYDATLPDLPDYMGGAELHTDDLDNGLVCNTRSPSPESASSLSDDPEDPALIDDYVSPDPWSSDDEYGSRFTLFFLRVYYANLAPPSDQSDSEMSTVGDDSALDDDLPNPGQLTPTVEPHELDPHVPPTPPNQAGEVDEPDDGEGAAPLPAHIRFLETLALDLHSRFGLTRAGVEYMLKLLDWSLGDTGMINPRAQDTETGTPPTLAKSLLTLLRRARIQTFGESAMRDHKKQTNRADRKPDVKEDIQHGKIWSELVGPDGDPFFTAEGDEIGLILALDWFDSTTMIGLQSHSTGVISMAIANLPPELRQVALIGLCGWDPENVIVIGTLPGPTETKTDPLANFLKPLMAELLELWGTPKTIIPEAPGERVRYIKAALVICVHISAFVAGAIRTSLTKLSAAMLVQLTNIAWLRLYAPSGYRHTALLQLPYWDGARMVVVDPMHCLFLGITKWQIQKIWTAFQHMREGDKLKLGMLNDIISSAKLPDFLGRPPPHTGTKKGGSLTADQLRTLITVIFPIAIPIIWGTIDKDLADKRALKVHQGRQPKQPGEEVKPNARRSASAPRRQNNYQQQESADHNTSGDKSPETPAHLCFHCHDDATIIDLALAIQNLARRDISTAQQERGDFHLTRYLKTFAKIRGLENMAFNHHLSTHMSEHIDDYGPLPNQWAYGSERLNRMLKNICTNSRKGGMIENTYANTFFHHQLLAHKYCKKQFQ